MPISDKLPQIFHESNCFPPISNHSTIESSFPTHSSTSTLTFSPSQSPDSQTEGYSLHHKIRELESAMLGPEYSDMLELECNTTEAEKWSYMKELLCACAKAVEEKDMLTSEWLISELRSTVSVSGNPIQRLGAYMLEGLIARLASSGISLCKALRCKEPTSSELLSYMFKFYEICPYFKFGYMSANGAIAEAVKDEKKIHIIDFQIAQGGQWVSLIQALAARPGGPPQVRITGIDDPNSAYARGVGLEIVKKRISNLAKSCLVPFEFHAIEIPGSEIQLEDLEVRPDEGVVVNFAFMLHHVPDESVENSQNHRDRLLRLVKSLSPKIMTVVEQECNTNTSFLPRFIETLRYYTSIFESIDVTLSRQDKERINVEQNCLARDIVNIIACEGKERIERHELLKKWRTRVVKAGFRPYPLSSFVNSTIEGLLKNYSEKYTLEERDGALYLGWENQPLVVSCAWS